MGDWNFLGGILEEVHIHSTIVGKIWLTVLFIFRMLVLGVAAEDVWNDEQVDFVCNTQQPGCRNVCYDQAFPISLIRYWVLQVIFVSSPSLVYMGHAIYRLRALEKQRHCRRAALRREMEALELEQSDVRRRVERELRQLEQGKLNKAPLRGSLLRTYVTHVVVRSVLEVGFMLGQHMLYGNHLDPLYRCEREPCPNLVDCFVSRPTEKSMFMVFMQVIAAVSLCLSLLEIMHLGYKKLKRGILDYYTHMKDDLNDYCGNNSKKNSVVQPGRKVTIPTAPTAGYMLLLEKKQTNGPMSPLLIGTSCIDLHTGSKAGQKDGQGGALSLTKHNSQSTSSGAQSPHERKPDWNQPEPLQMEVSDYPTLPVTNSTSCTKLQRITVMEGSPETDRSCNSSSASQQHGDSTGKRNKSTSTGGVSSDSHRSSTPSPNRRISLASSTGSRRATDLQI